MPTSPRQEHPEWADPSDPGRVITATRDSKCVDCGQTIHSGEQVLLRQYKSHHANGCPPGSGAPQAASAPHPITVTPYEAAIPDGTYELLKGEESFILKVHTVHKMGAAFDGRTVASIYVDGDWVSYAFIGDDGLVHVWKRYAEQLDWLLAARALLDPEIRERARKRYESR